VIDGSVSALPEIPEKPELVDSTLEGLMEADFKHPDRQTEYDQMQTGL
jgi:hypothetical protein